MPESFLQQDRPKKLTRVHQSSGLAERKESRRPSRILSERNSSALAVVDALPQALSSGRILRGSDRRIALPVSLVFASVCCRLERSNPLVVSAPTQQARASSDLGAAIRVLRLRRTPASMLVMLVRGVTPAGERLDQHQRRSRTH